MKSSYLDEIKYMAIRGHSDLPPISLDPQNSDQVDNHTILNALVATLVKYGSSGKIEPYLASSWSISEDGKVWTFNLKAGFTCEGGDPITPKNFSEGLVANFRRNLQKSDKSDFNGLVGWDSFISKETNWPSGLTYTNESITFNFEKPPAGLLNFLRMPYFGFWCPENFKGDLFRTDSKFSSSGPYRLENFLSKSKVLLSMRKNQPSYAIAAPQSIQIGYGSIEEISDPSLALIAKIIDHTEHDFPGYRSIEGPPLILEGLSLNTTKGFFSSLENRHAFYIRLNEFKKSVRSYNFSDGFYLGSKFENSISQNWPRSYAYLPKEKTRIAFQQIPISSEKRIFLENLFKYTLEGVDYELEYPDSKNPNWVKNMIHDNNFAARTTNVYAGAHHNISVIRMMFCSKLGISFEDPSGDICRLVQRYDELNLAVDNNFERKFNEIILRDASVHPLFHLKEKLLVSEKFDFSTIPTSIVHPLFEKIRAHE